MEDLGVDTRYRVGWPGLNSLIGQEQGWGGGLFNKVTNLGFT